MKSSLPWGLLLVLFCGSASAAELRFVRHEVDARSELAAAAAMDVNHDGRLDIVTGAAWYEAPAWKKHTVREVEFIRGRYDDYSCLPLDVNGDGWTDFITANYRSEKLAWIEHPGEKLGPWQEHVIEKPGPMETGRLYDINGDGRPDILPNGRDFAAWWELVGDPASGSKPSVVWRRHELPPQVIGHGVGFGDINGDGRGDVIGPTGWAAAPRDPRQPWNFFAEFDLGRDASVPILVLDVDGDGDNDLVWGRGHSCGVCWLEHFPPQPGSSSGRHRWTTHTIDTSWTQPHTIEAADLDNDGRPELIAGKRFLGHDGKDLGEWDPLVIYWYKYLPATRTWQRGAISSEKAGFDLDNKLIDLDADGDLDLVTAGRSGLYWFENLLQGGSGAQTAPATAETPNYEDHSRLMVYQDARGRSHPIKTPADWSQRRAHILAAFESMAGELPGPSHRVPLDVQITDSFDDGKYLRQKLSYAAEQGDRVPAWLLVPKGLKKAAPAMLCLHQTTPLGKDEPVGLGGSANLHYAKELAERGYVCLVPDYPSLGDYPYDFHSKRALPSGTMKAIWDNIRGLDLVQALPEVDARRIGAIGHSLGGHNAIFTALFDLRIKAVVSSSGFTALATDDVSSWTGPRYMPRLRNVVAGPQQELPFEFHELIAALAPRPFFTNSPQKDSDFSAAGVRKVMTAAQDVYALYNATDRLHAEYPNAPHDFPAAQREAAYAWLKSMLK